MALVSLLESALAHWQSATELSFAALAHPPPLKADFKICRHNICIAMTSSWERIRI
jgi:hypothetical protein